jgi:pyridoxal 5-phosphate dependent beta-lyase
LGVPPACEGLAERWREARPTAAGIHLDSGACSRQSFRAIEAAAACARREAEVGGYVAAQEADAVLVAGRAAVADLTGLTPDDVVFTTGATHALDLLLSSWLAERRVIDCVPGEFGPNLAVMTANDFGIRPLPVDDLGRVDLSKLVDHLAADPPTLVHLTVVPSHRGIVQPLAEVAAVCAEFDVTLVVDAAQGLGHVDCAVPADAIYSTSRKWLAGPRGVGVLAVRADRAATLQPRMPPPGWESDLSPLQCLELGEANIAARVGFSVAALQYVDEGPENMRRRLAEVGRLARSVLRELRDWRVVEPHDSPTAITTLEPVDVDVDVYRIRAELIEKEGIVTTAAGRDRAPFELQRPVLRVSPHVDVTLDEMEAFFDALS